MITQEHVVLKDTNIKSDREDLHFYGNGKLLLTGEYFILDGAQALAIPTKVGQSLSVTYRQSFDLKLTWKSYDVLGENWFTAVFEFWRFDILSTTNHEQALVLQKILRAVREQNCHFLRQEVAVTVETHLGFPTNWGLGSSSTLIHNIAQWAYVSPFELFFSCFKGSGYDIACAQSDMPIIYEKNKHGPNWSITKFSPAFKNNLYFLFLGKKQNSNLAIENYKKLQAPSQEVLVHISTMTQEFLKASTLAEFDFLIKSHERLIAKNIGLLRAKDLLFSDYFGEIKSLGAWGGDFVLVTSKRSYEETRQYFSNKGYNVFLPYSDLVLDSESLLTGTQKKYERILQ